MIPLQGKSFWESSPPMGPAKSVTRPRKDQATGRRKRRARKPRPRFCLLKGCEQKFHLQQARQRYCSEDCRSAARRGSQWKAQKRYRETAAGLEKRNSQSRRYRERAVERLHLKPLPAWIPEVYRLNQRLVDLEGYVALQSNRYSVPLDWIGRRVEVRESKDKIEIQLDARRLVTHHRVPEAGQE